MNEKANTPQCEQFAELISPYFDGQLSEEQSGQIEEHLQACAHCAQQLEHYRRIRALMGAEKQSSPIDLIGPVMGNLEREQLLTGLGDLVKPPTPVWIRLVRTVSAAAVIGLIVYAGTILVQLTGEEAMELSDHLPSAVEQPSRDLAFKDVAPGEKPVMRSISPAAAEAEPVEAVKELQAQIDEPLAAADVESVLVPDTEIASRLKAKEPEIRAEREAVLPLPPSAPMRTVNPDLTPLIEAPSADRKYLEELIPLTFEVTAPDLPTWMLLREQLFAILRQSRIQSVNSADQIGQALSSEQGFYYQARKGFDQPIEATEAQILVVVQPEEFLALRRRIHVSALETVRQSSHPALEDLIQLGRVDPTLEALADESIGNLYDYVGEKYPIALPTSQPTSMPTSQPVDSTETTEAEIGIAEPRQIRLVILLIASFEPLATSTAPASGPAPSTTAPATSPKETLE